MNHYTGKQSNLDQELEGFLNKPTQDMLPPEQKLTDTMDLKDYPFLKGHPYSAYPGYYPVSFRKVVSDLEDITFLDEGMVLRIVERLLAGETISIFLYQFKLR